MVDADMLGNLIVLSSHIDVKFYIQLLRVEQSGAVIPLETFPVNDEVTCVSLCHMGGTVYIMAVVWHEGKPSLHLYPLNEDMCGEPHILDLHSSKLVTLESRREVTQLTSEQWIRERNQTVTPG